MKISELKTVCEGVARGDIASCHSAYGVEITDNIQDVMFVRGDLKEVSIVPIVEDREFSRSTLLAVSTLISENIKVIVEISSTLDIDVESSVRYCTLLGCDISILPDDSVSNEEYGDHLLEFFEQSLLLSNFKGMIYPIGGYVSYLMGLEYGHTPEVLAKDDYTISRFVSPYSVEESDKIKDYLRPKIYDIFGGKAEFSTLAKEMAVSLLTKLKDEVETIEKINFKKTQWCYANSFINEILFRPSRLRLKRSRFESSIYKSQQLAKKSGRHVSPATLSAKRKLSPKLRDNVRLQKTFTNILIERKHSSPTPSYA